MWRPQNNQQTDSYHLKKKIVIISLGQPSTNPRTVKEAMSLSEAGFDVTVIYNYWSSWADETDKYIFNPGKNIKWICTGTVPDSGKILYLISQIRFKINRLIASVLSNSLYWQEIVASRCFKANMKKAISIKADLYIAHNLGALPVAARAASTNKTFYAFDVEDFHRGQIENSSKSYLIAKLIEDNYLPSAKYITSASPLIAKQYQRLYQKEITVINNVFSKKHIPSQIKKAGQPVSLFWFSQTVGKERGIEDIIQALKQVPAENFRLTLLGSCSDEMKQYFNRLAMIDAVNKINLSFLDPVHPDEIFSIASQYDIGLALEPGRDMNNQIALSNKIFTYLLAGNAVILSATPAQQLFYEENPGIGSKYACGNTSELAGILKDYVEQPELLAEHKRNASKLAAEKHNWEEESKKFIMLVHSLLGDA